MIDTSDARDAILSRIRGPHPRTTAEVAAAKHGEIVRSYTRTGSLNEEQKLDLFEERVIEYDARVFRIPIAALASTIGVAIRERGAGRMLVPAELPASWLPPGVTFSEAHGLSNHQINKFDGIVSGCTVAIALTGTIVLQNAPAQGPRRLSLIPDYHLCVVFTDQVVETVPEAFAWLASTSTLPTTFISGPSATADIEMTRIKGVHGPRFLDIALVC